MERKMNKRASSFNPADGITVHFILDESASMSIVHDATISSFNEYLEGLRKDGNSYRFQLTTFSNVSNIQDEKDIQNVDNLSKDNYKANGPSTSLYDAVCRTLKLYEDKEGKRLVVILTDGEENSSQEYNQSNMKEMVKNLESKGNWTFVYLGANQDSYANAANFGFSKGNVVNFNQTGVGLKSVSSNLRQATAMYAATTDWSTQEFYSEEQRTDIQGSK